MELIIDNTVEATEYNNVEVIIPSQIDVVEEIAEFEVSVVKKEYTIIGDSIFIPSTYEDAPPWLKEFINTTIDVAVTNRDQSLIDRMNSILTVMEYVPKNQYTEQINQIVSADGIINSRIATLNSNLTDAINSSNATIAEINLTYASKTEAAAIVTNALTASLSGSGEIGSVLIQLQEAYASLESTTAQQITMLESVMEGEITGNAQAMQTLRTYVGVDPNGGVTGTGLLADVQILQKQNDGVIETVTGTYDVMINPENPELAELILTAEPYATWRAADVAGVDTRLAHIGDVYIKYNITANGAREYIASFKFIRTVVDATDAHKSTDADGFTWAMIVDQAAQDAYNQALNAYDLADNKRRVFTTTPTIPYDIGDLWVRDISGSKQIWRSTVNRISGPFTPSEWVIASTDDTAVTALQTGLANGTTTIKLTNAYVGTVPLTTYLSSEIDNKVGVYSGTTAPVAGQPSGVAVNDIYLWFTTQTASGKTYDITRTYKYSGSVWNEITTNDDITNLADLADGKRTVFGGNVVPTGAVERDLWIPSANVSSYIKGEIYQYISGVWSPTTRYTADIQALTSNVQSQIDSKVDTYYQDTVPFANATNVARKTQAGDYWYCTLTAGSYVKGKMYKYVETANGSNWNYTWTETADVTKYAFDLADGKASIFTTSAQPSSYKINDMLIVTTASFSNGTTTFSNGVVLTSNATRTAGFVAADWIKKINDTEDLDAFVSGVYEPKVASLQSQVDGKIESWYTVSTSDPKVAWTTAEIRLQHNGDMWYQTDTKKSYWYSNVTHSWNLIEDQTAITALANAATAQAAADGVVVSFYAIKQDIAPATTSMWLNKTGTKVLKEYKTSWVNVAVQTGDTLMAYDPVTKDMSTYVYNGSGWITNTENGMVAESKAVTDLTASLNTTNGVVGGHTTQLSTVDTRIANGVASVETKWAYDSVVNINGVYKKSGFGLTTNYTSGSGTQADPYVSEFWIDASRFKFTNSMMTGSVAPFTIDANETTPQITFNGKVSFNSVTNAPSISSNLLYNSEPSLYGGTKGYVLGYNDTGTTAVVGQYVGDWAPSGSSSVYICCIGTPAPNTVFDINSEKRTPIVGGKTYCAYAYFGAHRCTAQLLIGFYDASGNIIQYIYGPDAPAALGGKSLSGYAHSTIKVVAPSNAASVSMIYRGKNTTGERPYVFVVRSYLGVIDSVNSETPEWSEGTAVTYTPSNVVSDINNGNTTTINGGRITTGSITANQIQAGSISADRLMAGTSGSTVWTGGGLVSANFNGNSYGDIGSPTSGFRLSANAAGTSSDPNMYGAYIKASYVESLYSPVVGTNNSGKFNYASSGSSVTVYGPYYSSGYLANRVTSLSSSILIVKGFFPFTASISRQSPSYSISKSLERSINGGVYTSVQTKSYSIVFGSINDYSLSNSHSLEFYYIEDLSALGNFISLSYTIPGSTVQLVLHN